MTSLVVQSRPSSSLVVQSATGGSLIVNTPGIPGPPAPTLQVQYSIDGSSWSTSYISNAMYIRLSLDGGSTYPVGPLRLKGDKGDIGVDGLSAYEVAVENSFVGTELDWLASLKGDKGDAAPNVTVQYSEDTFTWEDSPSSSDHYIRFSFDGGSTWGPELLVKGLKGDKGDAAPYLIIEYSEDGLVWSQTYHASDIYCRFSVDNGFSFGEALRIRGDKGDKGDTGRTILYGYTAPTIEGNPGDFYIDTSSYTLYGPKADTWPTGVLLNSHTHAYVFEYDTNGDVMPIPQSV